MIIQSVIMEVINPRWKNIYILKKKKKKKKGSKILLVGARLNF